MEYWGVKSYENDGAADALDAGFDRAAGERYEALMDDRNPLSFEQVQAELASPRTLAAAIEALESATGTSDSVDEWDDWSRLALVGIVVRHAELGVPIPEVWRCRAIEWLRHEEIDWEEATLRRLRLGKELGMLERLASAAPSAGE